MCFHSTGLQIISFLVTDICPPGQHPRGEGGGKGGLRISSDRDDQRIFWGLKFSIPGFFWVGKFGMYFLGTLI